MRLNSSSEGWSSALDCFTLAAIFSVHSLAIF